MIFVKRFCKSWQWILALALVIYIIKNIFVGVDNDETYGIVVGYRLAMGDRLLLEMWEPHQTSAIFTALLMKPFLWLRQGNVSGLNIYLRVVYFGIHGLISYGVYRTFRFLYEAEVGDTQENESAKWIGLIFFVSIPKCICIPEYSNLHIWFLTLLSLSLVWVYSRKSPMYGRSSILLLSGTFLACDVLAYPSMLLLYPFCILFIVIKRKEKFWKDTLLFTLPCVAGAVAMAGYVLSYMSWEQICEVVPYILGDGSHSLSASHKWMDVLVSVGQIMAFLGGGTVVAGVVTLCGLLWYKRKCNSKMSKKAIADFFLIVLFVILIIQQFYFWFTSCFNASYPHVIYIYLYMTGIYYWIKTDRKEGVGLYLIGLSLVSYIGVILMSNWEAIHLIPYLIVGVCGGLLYWYRYLSKQYYWGDKLVKALCALLVFSNIFGYCYLMIGGAEVHADIFEVGGYSREGLRKGIFAEYMTAYRYNMNQEIWSEAIAEGSNVLVVGYNPVFYMQGDCTIASGSTISTPTYDEGLLAYWELNPDRYPDVVVFESMWGRIDIANEDSFIMKWVLNEFEATEKVEYPYVTVFKK